MFSGRAVAFEADDGEYLYTSSRIVFKNILFNTRNAFSSSTGIFTAPYAGLYLFSARICDNRHSTFSIRSNGYIIVETTVNTPGTTVCRSLTCVIDLSYGDEVYVYVYISKSSSAVDPNVENKFSGYRIQ